LKHQINILESFLKKHVTLNFSAAITTVFRFALTGKKIIKKYISIYHQINAALVNTRII